MENETDTVVKTIPETDIDSTQNLTDKIHESDNLLSDTEDEYAVLMETNGLECESWYYFIKRKGNEEALKFLQDQLEQVDWYILDDLSTFDLDLTHYVSAKTAKEMTMLELNAYSFHRKFDGLLDNINLKFKKKDSNDKKICKTFDCLGYGQIEDYIDCEDVDSDCLTDESESDFFNQDDYSDSEDESESSDYSESEDSETQTQKRVTRGMPPVLHKNDLNWIKSKHCIRKNHNINDE